MSRIPRATVVLAVLLLISLAGNGVLAWLALDQYRGELRVRLDPTAAATFEPLNAALPPAPAGNRRVVFVGDSRTQMWRALPAVEGCQMVNRGRSHDTSGQLLLRIERDALALKPALIVLEIGANDLKSIGALPGEERRITDRLRANRNAMIEHINARGIPLVVCTIFPFGDVTLRRRPLWSDRIDAARVALNDELRRLVRPGVTVFDADRVLAVGGRLKKEYQRDELHLNDAAYRALNEALASVIDRSARTRPTAAPTSKNGGPE